MTCVGVQGLTAGLLNSRSLSVQGFLVWGLWTYIELLGLVSVSPRLWLIPLHAWPCLREDCQVLLASWMMHLTAWALRVSSFKAESVVKLDEGPVFLFQVWDTCCHFNPCSAGLRPEDACAQEPTDPAKSGFCNSSGTSVKDSPTYSNAESGLLPLRPRPREARGELVPSRFSRVSHAEPEASRPGILVGIAEPS